MSQILWHLNEPVVQFLFVASIVFPWLLSFEGHSDIGECWREETEIPHLKMVASKLYSEVKHLYEMLHTFVRFKLEQFYKMDFNGGPIPSHLLGKLCIPYKIRSISSRHKYSAYSRDADSSS